MFGTSSKERIGSSVHGEYLLRCGMRKRLSVDRQLTLASFGCARRRHTSLQQRMPGPRSKSRSPSPRRDERRRSRSPRRRRDDEPPKRGGGGFKWKERRRDDDGRGEEGERRLERGYRDRDRPRSPVREKASREGPDEKSKDKKERKERRAAAPSAAGQEPMIIVNVNDRLGTKAAIPCLASDPISKFSGAS